MPMLSDDQQRDYELGLGSRGSLPEAQGAQGAPEPGLWGAAFQRGNLFGTAYERLTHPKSDSEPEAGFDPVSHVPEGYEHVAPIFIHAQSPADIQWTKDQYDREQKSLEIIASHHGYGVAATMAAGLVDPVTLASMAIPGGGEARLATAARNALIAGSTAAAQTALQHQLEVSPTSLKSDALNVAGSAVFGGVLGSILHRVPTGEFNRVSEGVTRDLHSAEGGERAVGPIDGRQRIFAEEKAPASMNDVPPMQRPEERTEPASAAAEGERATEVGVTSEQLDDAINGRTPRAPGEPERKEPPIAQFRRDAAVIERSLPPVEEGMTRVWRGNRPGELGQNPQFTNSLDGIALPFRKGYGGQLSYVDVPSERFAEFQNAEKGSVVARDDDGKSNEVVLPKELAAKARDVTDAAKEFALSRQAKATVPRQLPEVPTGISTTEPEMYTNMTGEQSMGAAGISGPDIRGTNIARGAQTADKLTGFVSPASRVGRSQSLKARQVLQEMVNIPGKSEDNYRGIASPDPIERNIWKQKEGLSYQGIAARDALWQQMRQRVAKEGGQQLDRAQFGEEISKAMRRNDSHDIPEVAQAAKATRDVIFEPIKQRLIKAGLLPADVKPQFADSYLMRQYDAVKIHNEPTGWHSLLVKGFVQQGVDTAEARDLAHQVTRQVMGSERGMMDWKAMDGIVPKSGRLKERTLALPDSLLEPYLNNNIDLLSHSYLQSTLPELEFTERFGSRDMKDQIGDIHDDYARMIERAPDDKAKSDLYDRMNADVRDLTGMRDVLFGTYGQPKDPSSFFIRAGRLMRAENGVRLLGGGTLAHFPDVANVMMRYGMPRTFAAMGKLLVSSGAREMSSTTAKRLGVGIDLAMARVSSWFRSSGDGVAPHSQFPEQKFASNLLSKFLVFTGETPLVTGVQQLASTMAQDEIIRSAQKIAGGGTLSKNTTALWAAAGLDKDMLSRIAGQHEQFGANVTGLKFGMSDLWTDKAAAQAFESAVVRESHGVTLRPGAGDMPLMGHTEWFRMLRQFTSFGYAAQRAVVNPILQGLAHGDVNAVQGLMALVGAGAMSYMSKQTAAGQPIEDPMSGRFAMEVLDKSNMLGWLPDYLFPALWTMGQKNLSRWSDRDPMETIGGPTLGTLGDIYTHRLPAKLRASAGLNDSADDAQPFNRADLHFMRRLTPMQNHFMFRGGINYLEDALGDAMDLPGKSNKDRADERAAEIQQ